MANKSITVTAETEEIVRHLDRGNESYVYREAVRAFDRLLSLLGDKWEFNLHQAAMCYRLFSASLDEANEAARALAEMRRLFGPDWENEVKRFEKVVREV